MAQCATATASQPGVSREYSLIFATLAVACVTATWLWWNILGLLALVLLTPVLSCTLLAIAYAGVGPRLLLKRASGRQSFWAWVLFAPYFWLNQLTFALYRRLSTAKPYVQVAPNVYLGRKLTAAEAEATRWISVLDLAAEFAEALPLRQLTGYWSLPVLDATAPSADDLQAAVVWLTSAALDGPVYVHCALGHGRSACVVIGYLLSTGEVSTPAEGVARLQALRPGVKLHPAQLQLLESLVPNLHSTGRRLELEAQDEHSSFCTAG